MAAYLERMIMDLWKNSWATKGKITYSMSAPKTNRMHANIQASIAVRPSALGVFVVTVLKMLTKTRNKVTNNPILPGITSMGIRKEIQDTITNSPKYDIWSFKTNDISQLNNTWWKIVSYNVSGNISSEDHLKSCYWKVSKGTKIKKLVFWFQRLYIYKQFISSQALKVTNLFCTEACAFWK